MSGKFNEGMRMKRFWVMFQVWQRLPGINPQAFPTSTWEPGHFFMFFHFSKYLQNIQLNPCGFILDIKKVPLKKSAKFQCRFLIFNVHFLQGTMDKNFNFALHYILSA